MNIEDDLLKRLPLVKLIDIIKIQKDKKILKQDVNMEFANIVICDITSELLVYLSKNNVPFAHSSINRVTIDKDYVQLPTKEELDIMEGLK